MSRFIAHNSRAITAKQLGRVDESLPHFYAASEAANATGWAGPRITALGNLGGRTELLREAAAMKSPDDIVATAAREALAR